MQLKRKYNKIGNNKNANTDPSLSKMLIVDMHGHDVFVNNIMIKTLNFSNTKREIRKHEYYT